MELDPDALDKPSELDAFAAYADDESGDAIPFYEAEGQVLALWDQLNELKLEMALLEASMNPPPVEHLNDLATGARLKEAEKELLEARATYTLRQNVVEDVLVADPILKAVHSGANATPTERSLRPLIDRRDVLGIASTNLTSILQSTWSEITKAKSENISTAEKNRKLAASLVTLSSAVQSSKSTALQELQLDAKLEKLRDDTATAKKRRRVMKSVVAAVVVGSGVDWARNDSLRQLVLDDEDDED